MFKIKRIRVEILTDQSKGISDLYGFDFGLNKGLNIIAGPNSRGKTTVNSCLYYALGMEELLGAHNEKALDKALKEEFTILKDASTEEENTYKVLTSKVLLEIENSQDICVTLERYIKSTNGDIKTSNIAVLPINIESYLLESYDNINREIYFVNAEGNNENPNGFYNWLSNFITIEIPQVSNNSKTNNYSPLYLQTVFSALFIEQTKGWSDFFATMPFFGITKAKEKIVEFLLGLNEIELSTQKDILNKKKYQILEEWKRKTKSFSYLQRQTNAMVVNIPEELTMDKSAIEAITAVFSKGEDEKLGLKSYLLLKKGALEEFENRPISTIRENREQTILEYNTQKEKYEESKAYANRFEHKLRTEQNQITILESQLKTISLEIKDHLNLKKVFSENIINERGTNQCPTCTQDVTIDLISSKNIKIPQLTLEENTNFLKSQKRIIEASLKSLKETVKEKETLLIYFRNSLREKEYLIKSLSKDLIADDRAFSESDVVKKLQLEREIENLNLFEESLLEIKNELEALADKYHNNEIEIGLLGSSEEQDTQKINSFEVLYKSLLFSFGYESNEAYKISINKKEPFKYFPVYKKFKDDPIPQSIRINSSASDFVRNIWAYTLALLKEGTNHPGVVIFDEPGQHRTNLNSLKALFNSCSKINHQTIIFTSIDKQLNDKEKIDLDILISELPKEDYKLIRLDNIYKVIGHLI